MTKFALFLVLVNCVFAIRSRSAYAGSELENWCESQKQAWDPYTSTCTVSGVDEIEIDQGLTIGHGESLVNLSDKLVNCCRFSSGVPITNHGTFLNPGFFVNYGTFDNFGTFDNQAYINTFGTFKNNGAFYNSGLIRNHLYNGFALIENNDTIYNADTITGGPGCYLENKGIIQNGASLEFCNIRNFGIIDNNGSMENVSYDLSNFGTIDNSGIIHHGRYDDIYNGGIVANYDTFISEGDLYNRGTINNLATFKNEGAIYQLCDSVGIEGPVTGSGVIIDLDSCGFLPLAAR